MFLRSLLLTLGLALTQSSAWAETLLIIASSESLFDSDRSSLAFERFGNNLVEVNLYPHYRKIYRWQAIEAEAGGEHFPVLWNRILMERLPGEKIDVFVMEHGPYGVLEYGLAEDEIPAGFIRRYYSTGCKAWGWIKGSADLSSYDWRRVRRKDQTHDNSVRLKQLEVEEYILHANNNSTTLFLLPYLLNEMSKGGSWLEAGKRAFDRMDDFALRFIDGLRSAAQAFGVFDPDFAEESAEHLKDWIASRPILGGARLPLFREKLGDRALSAGYYESLLKPAPSLASWLTEHCPDVFQDENCFLYAADDRSQVRAIRTLVEIVNELAVALAGSEEGCLNSSAFQDLVSAGFSDDQGRAPILGRLCMARKGKDAFDLSWVFLNAEDRPYWRLGDAKNVDVEVEESSLEGIRLKNRGSFRFRFSEKSLKVKISGLALRLNQLPRMARTVGVKALTLRDDGDYAARLRAPVIRLPMTLMGDIHGESEMRIRILGIPIGL